MRKCQEELDRVVGRNRPPRAGGSRKVRRRMDGWMDERGGRQDQGNQAYKAPVRTPKK